MGKSTISIAIFNNFLLVITRGYMEVSENRDTADTP